MGLFYIQQMGRRRLREGEWPTQDEKSGGQRPANLSSSLPYPSLLPPPPPKSHLGPVRDPPSVWQRLQTHWMLFALPPGHIFQPTLQLPCAVTELWPVNIGHKWQTPVPGLVPQDSLCGLPCASPFPIWVTRSTGFQSFRWWGSH